jgi:hypothetical protein
MENRDNYTRCKQCGQLFSDETCILDDVKGLLCPNGCVESFEQPAYQSPLQE